MEVVILPNEKDVAELAADIVCAQMEKKPASVLGLPTGGTPVAMYAELIRRYQNKKVSFKKAKTFNLDEYIGIPETHPGSYRTFMNETFFKHVDIPLSRTHVPNGNARNPLREGPRYERLIIKAGGVDLQILGIGRNGHIGFNEPTSSLGSRTRIKALTESTIRANQVYFKPDEKQPLLAITMGVGSIMEAKRILLLATGESKADAVQKTIEGAVSSMVPASILQFHNRVQILVDYEAASKLQLKDYYRWVRSQQKAILERYGVMG